MDNIPEFKTIRETARTGILPEACLRRMVKHGSLPGFYSGVKFLVNYTALVEKLNSTPEKEENANA